MSRYPAPNVKQCADCPTPIRGRATRCTACIKVHRKEYWHKRGGPSVRAKKEQAVAHD